MIRNLTLVLFLLITVPCLAQKPRVGYINHDSLYMLMPGYKAYADSITRLDSLISFNLRSMDSEMRRKQHELDSVRSTSSPLMIKLREQQIRQLLENKTDYQLFAQEERYHIDTTLKADYVRRMNAAKLAAEKQNNCTAIYDIKGVAVLPANIELVNLNAIVAKELGIAN